MSAYLDKTQSLTPLARRVIGEKATEYPHTGSYVQPRSQGTYLCRRCGLALFRADSQFSSGCGWPSFDAEIANTVKHIPDADGLRTEILCSRCDGHLGHIFTGEQFTLRNRRYCVNSASIDYVVDDEVLDSAEAIVAGGCFWGVEFYLTRLPGVLKVEAGYTGGMILNPSYEQLCAGTSGHYEAVRVVYDSAKIDYLTVVKHFFEIHDPTQKNGQGPDIGQQYQSAVFYYDDAQHADAQALIQQLKQKGYDVCTRLLPVQTFWPAEEYHQQYYHKHNKLPYCHHPLPRFK